MDPVPSVRGFLPHEWRTYRDLRLRALADSPDAFSRMLAEEKDRPDIEWASRLTAGADTRWNLPLVAEIGAEPIGLAWGRIEPSEPEGAHLYQMWVDPRFRRLGAGQMLLQAVIDWARDADVRYLVLGVTCGDSAARRLYSRAGFKPVGEPEPLRPGSTLLSQSMRLGLRGDATQTGHSSR
jgi:ribosomal protein S18 acetylase RimI-like enzyme